MLTYKPIISKDSTYYDIKALYRSSFPTLEQLPWFLLSYRALTGYAQMIAFFNNKQAPSNRDGDELNDTKLNDAKLDDHKFDITEFDDTISDFIGFAYLIPYKDIICIMFMAVPEHHQGKGYGSEFLKKVRELYPHHRLCLYMEELNPAAEKYDERIIRSRFYERNGYVPMHYTVHESNVVYDMLASGGDVKEPEYNELMKRFLGPYLYAIYHKPWDRIFTALKFIP